MQTATASQSQYLKLDSLAADAKMARRLPADLAWRCHALPLAQDRGCITVAMADPYNAEARAAVIAALGPKSYVVRGSAAAIDARLTEIWGHESCPPEAKVCAYPNPPTGEQWDFAQALGTLLGTRPGRISTSAEVIDPSTGRMHADSDLIIFGEPCHPWIGELLSQSTSDQRLARPKSTIPFAVLVAREPRWPIERILLILCADSTDGGALDWALRLARPCAAAVIVLAVAPPVSATLKESYPTQQGLASLLVADTSLGKRLHQAARHLAVSRVNSTLRLCQGAPGPQICREMDEGDHDLLIIGARSCQRELYQLGIDPIYSLLSRVKQPVLLAEPKSA